MNDIINAEDIHSVLKTKFPGFIKSEVFGNESEYNTGVKLSSDYISRSGLRNLPQVFTFIAIIIIVISRLFPKKSLIIREYRNNRSIFYYCGYS